MTKGVAALLAAVLLLQLWILNRQSNLEEQVQRYATEQHNTQQRLMNEMNGVQRSLHEMAQAERWVAVKREDASPVGSCASAQVSITWELLQWVPGTRSRLVYRAGADQDWQEAEVTSWDGQNYAATFPIEGKPTLRAGLSVERIEPRKSVSSASGTTESGPPGGGGYEYQILAEGPESRSTGARPLPVYGLFDIPVKVIVQYQPEKGEYEVKLYHDAGNPNACARVEGAEVRSYAGDLLVSTTALTGPKEWEARWQSQTALSRLEIVVEHQGGPSVVDVPLH